MGKDSKVSLKCSENPINAVCRKDFILNCISEAYKEILL